MLLFHGTRKTFSKFDQKFFGSGEAGVGVGFYFTDSLKGAYQHASRYAPQPGESKVYVCEIPDSALTLNPWLSISMHSSNTQRQWEKLPLAQYCAKDTNDWFGNLFRMLPFGNPVPEPDESGKYAFLRKHGFQTMYDAEGSYTDAYLYGTTVVVLDESIIDIIEVLPAEQLHEEMLGEAKQYELGSNLEPLGKSAVLSYLRNKTSALELHDS